MSDKFAVLVAVERYADPKWKPVRFAEADARDLSAALLELGFPIHNQSLLINQDATKARIDSHLRRRVDALLEDDELFIYYAGHGFAEVNRNYLTCHDSEALDMVRTSMPLQEVFDFVRSSRAHRIILFLDSCNSGPVVLEEDRGLVHDMNESELREFFNDSEYFACFTSCKTTEKSYPSAEYGHGIWTYHLLQALQGKDAAAIERNALITSRSLQNYLARQVRLSVRKSRSDMITQTPTLYCSITKDFIVADVGPLLAARRAATVADLPTLRRVAFCSERRLRVKSLSGFRKWHRVPDAIDGFTTGFLHSISETELEKEIEKLRSVLRSDLNYARKQVEVETGSGSATIFTPDFSLEIALSLAPDDPSMAVLKIEMINISNAELVSSEPFNQAFSRTFDVIEFEYAQAFALEEMVDHLEEIHDGCILLDYPADLSYCRLEVKDFHFAINVTSDRVRFEYKNPASPKNLLKGLAEANRFFLAEHDIRLLGA